MSKTTTRPKCLARTRRMLNQRLLWAVACLTIGLPPVQSQTTVKWEETWNTLGQPSGWLVVNRDTSTAKGTNPTVWRFSTAIFNAQSQPYIFPRAGRVFAHSNVGNANYFGLIDEWLISPHIKNIEAGDSLSFFAGASDGDRKDSLRVLVSTTDFALSSFTHEVAYFKVDGPEGWYNEYTFDLSAFAGEDIFFAINYLLTDSGLKGTSGSLVYVDHFTITHTPVTSVASPAGPKTFRLLQNRPNPFATRTAIPFVLPTAARVTLAIYDLLGRKVATLAVNESLTSGEHRALFDARDLPVGVYFYRLKMVDASGRRTVQTRKMIHFEP